MDLSKPLNEYKIGFVGGGNMAKAMVIPLVQKGILPPENLWISAKTDKTLSFWRQISHDSPVHTTLSNTELINSCDIVFLAVKPQLFDDALTSIKNLSVTSVAGETVFPLCPLFVSIMAGVPLIQLERKLLSAFEKKEDCVRIIRTLPNVALSVGEGITVYCRNEHTSATDAFPVVALFSHLGVTEEIPEFQMDTAGALAGSGPAYAYLMVEALADGAVKNGLPRALAMKLAAQVFAGAGKMVLETGKHPGQLKDEVCSPGGTTIAGIHALEEGRVRASLMNAIEAAFKRSRELGSSK